MQTQTVSCLDCNSSNVVKILYGYPSSVDFPNRWIYGGAEAFPNAPTHYCANCNETWILAGTTAIYFPFPEHCNFCDELLSSKDRFLYSTEYEGWIERDESPFTLESGTFSDFPYPTCAACREGIHENQKALDSEKLHEERMRVLAIRFAIAGLIFFVLLVTWCLFMSSQN